MQGFLKSAGLASLDAAKIETDKKGGQFYVAVIERKGAATLDVLAEILPDIIKNFSVAQGDALGRCFRRAERLCAGCARCIPFSPLSGRRPKSPEIVPFEIGGITAGNITYGHRFMAPGPIKVRRFDDYLPKL